MMVPDGPMQDASGRLTTPWAIFFQNLALGQGGPAWHIIAERVDDESFKFRMRGKDGVWRESSPVTLV